jgi:putative FmdB family regulatory protein
MPIYEYECKDCGFITEKLCGLKDKNPQCQSCDSPHTEKIMSTFSFKEGPTQDFKRGLERAARVQDMQAELKNDYGIEKIKTVKNELGKTYEDTYKDIKANGQAIKDSMKEDKEKTEIKLKEKRKKWMEGALKRTPERGKKKLENRKIKEKQMGLVAKKKG